MAFEVASLVVFARLQRWLLRSGGVRLPLLDMVKITVAGNAMAATLPGGVAWSAAWVFDQLRQRGVDRFLRVWVFLVAGAVSSFALFLILSAGVWLAGSDGPVAGLRWLVAVLAAIPPLALAAMFLRRTRVLGVPIRRVEATAGRWGPGRRAIGAVRGVSERVRAIHLDPKGWFEVLGLGLLNWICDCAVLIACLLALHISVPWRGIFVIYTVTQIAGVLPFTPGGIGVVEASLAALLTAYGVPTQQALAGVILYRLVSFWGVVPAGWAVWITLDLLPRRRGRHAEPAPGYLDEGAGADASSPAIP
jgi:uncharacterized membrane protein YbhN (UPF0104 family)